MRSKDVAVSRPLTAVLWLMCAVVMQDTQSATTASPHLTPICKVTTSSGKWIVASTSDPEQCLCVGDQPGQLDSSALDSCPTTRQDMNCSKISSKQRELGEYQESFFSACLLQPIASATLSTVTATSAGTNHGSVPTAASSVPEVTTKGYQDQGRQPSGKGGARTSRAISLVDVTTDAVPGITYEALCWNVTVPDKIEGLRWSATTNTTVGMDWESQVAASAQGYNVEIRWENHTEDTNATSYEVSPLKPGSLTDVSVRACLTIGGAPCWTKVCSVPSIVKVYTLPRKPGPVKDLKNGTVGHAFVTLEWQQPSERNGPIDFYEIKYEGPLGNSPTSTAHNVSGKEIANTIRGLQPWSEYNVSVAACNEGPDGKVFCGPEVDVVVHTDADEPSQARDLKNLTVTSTAVELEWLEPSVKNGHIDIYEVLWNATSGDTSDGGSDEVNGNETTYAVQNLKPWVRYDIAVTACTRSLDGSRLCGKRTSLQVRTSVDKPGLVYNLHKRTVGPTSVELEWQEPSEKNGPIDFYRIEYDGPVDGDLDRKTRNVSSINTSHVIESLKPWSEYNVSVRACNKETDGSILCGEAEDLTFRTDADEPGVVRDLKNLTVTSTAVQLEWLEPSVKNGLIDIYEVAWNATSGGPSDSGSDDVNGNETTYTVKKLKPWVGYDIAVAACTRSLNGSRLCGKRTSLKVQTSVDKPGPVHNLQKRTVGPTFVELEWQEPSEKNGPIDSYRIEYDGPTDGDLDHKARNVSSINTSHVIESLKPWSEYNVSVRACNKETDGNILCGEAEDLTFRTDADKPGLVRDLKNLTVTSTAVELEWLEPSVKNGLIDIYEVVWNATSEDTSDGGSDKVNGNETTYTVQKLKPWVGYDIAVAACTRSLDGSRLCGKRTSLKVQTSVDKPGPVYNLQKRAVGPTSAKLEWQEPSEKNGPIDFYRVEYDGPVDGDIDHKTQNVSSINTSHVIEPLKPWSEYNVSVRACNKETDGNILCGEAKDLTFRTDADKPGPVEELRTTSVKSKSADLQWRPPSVKNGAVDFYLIIWKESPGDSTDTKDDSVPGNETEYSVQDLKPWSSYNITVTACNYGRGKNKLCGDDDTLTIVTEVDRPSVPTNLQEGGLPTNSSLTIAWDPPLEANGPLDGYNVTWSVKGTSDVNFVEVNGTGAVLVGLVPYTTYVVQVRAYNQNGNSILLGTAASLESTTQQGAPSAPTNVSWTECSRNVTISWDYPVQRNGPIDGFVVEWAREDSSHSPLKNETVTGNTTEAHLRKLEPYVRYTVTVYAYNVLNAARLRGEEVSIRVLTHPEPPSEPTKVHLVPGTRNISISWGYPENKNGPVNGFVLEWSREDSPGEASNVKELANSTTYLLENLAPYVQYKLALYAYNTLVSEKLRGKSYVGLFFTLPEPPGPVSIVEVKPFRNNSVKLVWRRPSEPRGILSEFQLFVSETKTGKAMQPVRVPASEVCGPAECEHVFCGLAAEFQYQFDIRGINENVSAPGDPPNQRIVAIVPPGDPPGAQNLSTVLEGIPHKAYSQRLFTMSLDTFDDFNGAIIAYDVVAADPTRVGSPVVENVTWAELMSRDVVLPYRATPRGWNPFTLGSSGGYDPMACSVLTKPGRMVCILGAQDCAPDAKLPCNGPLKPGTVYAMYVTGHTAGGSRATAPLVFSTEPLPSSGDGGAVAGAVIGVILVAVLVLAGVLYVRRRGLPLSKRKAQKNGVPKIGPTAAPHIELVHITSTNGTAKKAEPVGTDNPVPVTEETPVYEPSGPIRKAEFPEYLNNMLRDSGYKFYDEYERLVELSPQYKCDAARNPANTKKNRFTNIHPFDKNRVPLSQIGDDPNTTYINASFIRGYNGTREYVAAQGPNATTVSDFWRMIWEHDIHCIVMLTQCVERNKKKCEQYWPEDDEVHSYGPVEVKRGLVTTQEDYTVTEFFIKSDDSSKWRQLSHVFFTGWPDHGVPDTPDELVNFVRACQEFFGPRTGDQPPVLVHCSAGVGRTGTFIALDYLMQLLEVQDTIDIFDLVLQLREYRRCMVQNESQYVYLHKCVKAVLEESDASPAAVEDEPIYENVQPIRPKKI